MTCQSAGLYQFCSWGIENPNTERGIKIFYSWLFLNFFGYFMSLHAKHYKIIFAKIAASNPKHFRQHLTMKRKWQCGICLPKHQLIQFLFFAGWLETYLYQKKLLPLRTELVNYCRQDVATRSASETVDQAFVHYTFIFPIKCST